MSHLNNTVRDDDVYFSIDPESREVTCLSEEPIIIASTDHASERFTFEIPRHIEGHDMLECNSVQAHYINISTDRRKQNLGVHDILDLAVSEDDDETLICTWLVSQDATMLVGSLSFSLRFMCLTGSKIDYSWSTISYSGIIIAESINNTQQIATQYTDVLQAWYIELMLAGSMGINVVEAATNESIANIKLAEAAAIERIQAVQTIRELEAEAIERIKKAESDTLESEREKLIQDLISRLSVYEGETEDM